MIRGFEKRPTDLPNSEYIGHNIQEIGPERIAGYFSVEVSRGTRKSDLKKLLLEYGDDIEIRFILTQDYRIIIGDELHEQLIDNNSQRGEKYLMGVMKMYKLKEMKILSPNSEAVQFFKTPLGTSQ